MGVIKRGILGGFSNKVGNIVGSSWKGIAVVKSLPLSVANPRTAGQVMQRNRFSVLTVLGSNLLAAIIKPLWDRFATAMSGFNAFISANRNAFYPTGELNMDALQMSAGRILKPTLSVESQSGSSVTMKFTHPVNDRFALPTDRLYVVAIDNVSQDVGAAEITAQTRGAGASTNVTFSTKANWTRGGDAYFYGGYLRADGSEVSNSASIV